MIGDGLLVVIGDGRWLVIGDGRWRHSGDGRLGCAVDDELDARQAVQADQLDQMHDLGLRALQEEAALATPQTVGQHRQIDHQGRVGEHEVTQIDEDVTLGAKSQYKRSSAEALRTPILIPGA